MPAGGAYQRAPPPRGSRGDAAESSRVGRGKKEGAEQPMEGGGGALGGARGAARAGLRRGGAQRAFLFRGLCPGSWDRDAEASPHPTSPAI